MEPILRLGQALAGRAPASPVEWQAVWEAARAARLEPLLLHLYGPALPQSERDALDAQARRVAFANLYAQRELQQLLAALPGERVVLLKGAVLEALAYPPSVARSTNDLDLLVAPEGLPRVDAALVALGYRRHDLYATRPASRAALHEHLYSREVVAGRVRQPIEVHTALCQPFRHRLHTHPLLARAVPFQGALRLEDTDQLLHLAVHLSKEQFRSPAKHLYDVHRWVLRGLSWDEVLARAAETATRSALFETLRLSQRVFETPVPGEVLAALRPPRPVARWLAHWHAPRGTRLLRRALPMRAAQLLLAPALFDGPRDLWRALSAYGALRLRDRLRL